MATVVLPWLPPMSAQFVGPEVTDAAQIEQDPIVRYDLEDDVDAEHYPDGRYWRFDRPDVAARLIVVAGSKIVQISDVYQTIDGQFMWATRKTTDKEATKEAPGLVAPLSDR